MKNRSKTTIWMLSILLSSFCYPIFMELLCCFNHTHITPGPMSEQWEIYADWNPWHGCTKISTGCKYCYVYCQDEMYGSDVANNLARKTAAFFLPVKRKRDRSWKIEPGKIYMPGDVMFNFIMCTGVSLPCSKWLQ